MMLRLNPSFRSALAMLALTGIMVTAQGPTQIEGQVTDVNGASVKIALAGDLVPATGDRVEISATVPGLGAVPLQGAWIVRQVDGRAVVAETTDRNAAQPQAGQRVAIFSVNPRRLAAEPTSGRVGGGGARTELLPPTVPGPVRIAFGGRILTTTYERNTDGRGEPIDMYFYQTVPPPGAPTPIGDQVWNKLVRSPAVGVNPGAPVVWWHFHWEFGANGWTYVQEQGVKAPEQAR